MQTDADNHARHVSVISKSRMNNLSRKINHTLMHHPQLSCFWVFCYLSCLRRLSSRSTCRPLRWVLTSPDRTHAHQTAAFYIQDKAPSYFICEMSWNLRSTKSNLWSGIHITYNTHSMKWTSTISIMIHIINCQQLETERYFSDWIVNLASKCIISESMNRNYLHIFWESKGVTWGDNGAEQPDPTESGQS